MTIIIIKVFIKGFKQTLKLTRSIINEDTAVYALITINLESKRRLCTKHFLNFSV